MTWLIAYLIGFLDRPVEFIRDRVALRTARRRYYQRRPR